MNQPESASYESQAASALPRVRALILQTFPAANRVELADEDSLFEAGIVDSMGVLDIVGFLESDFNIAPTDDEMIADNFESIATIASFIATKQRVANS